MKRYSLYALMILLFAAAPNMLFATNYYVKTDGGGDGSSWDNAFSPSDAKTAVEAAVAGDTFFFAEGTYKFGSVLTVASGIVIQGSYADDLTGNSTDITYPTSDATIFSGNNTHPVLLISSTSKVVIKGITVTEGLSTANGNVASDVRPGIHIRPNVSIDMYYCKSVANISEAASSSSAGGAGFYIESTGVQAYLCQTEIANNTANNRGGGVRVVGVSTLTLDQCLVRGNSINGNYGGGIQGSGVSPTIVLINTTVTGNSSGGFGGGVSCDGKLYVISSTIANNSAGVTTEGVEIRSRNAASVFKCINSIVVGGAADAMSTNTVNHISGGFNIWGSSNHGSGGGFTTLTTDLANETAATIFGTNSLQDSGGYLQTYAPLSLIAGATIEELNSFKAANDITVGDVSLDARGFPRATEGRICRGAYDNGTSFEDTIIVVDNTKYPLIQDSFVVWGNGYGENKLVRFPAKWQTIIPTENNIWQRVTYSAGMQIRFRTNAVSLIVNCANSKYTSNDWFGNAGANAVDLFIKKQDGKFYPCYSPTNKRNVASRYEFEIDPQDSYYTENGYEYILYLPSTGTVSGLSIEVNEGASFKFIPVSQAKKPIVFYGTSIMNGIAASRAAFNYTNIISRSIYDRNIVNLGFSGTGRMEPEVIAAINEIDAEIYILDNMPNMQTSQYVGMIKQRAIAAVDSLMKYHPNSSIVLTEHCGYANMKIYRPQYNAVNNANAELKAAYDILKVRYPNLRYITREELGLNMATDIADYIHPNDKGMHRYAEKYLEVINEILGR